MPTTRVRPLIAAASAVLVTELILLELILILRFFAVDLC
jgi:hypothetical protein